MTDPLVSPPDLAAAMDAEHRGQLIALRDKLAAELDAAPAAYVAALARQLQAVLSELAAIDKATPDPDSPIDRITAERAARLAAAGVTPPNDHRRPRKAHR